MKSVSPHESDRPLVVLVAAGALALLASALGLVGCAAPSGAEGLVPADAPLITDGKADGGGDRADCACRVVLRSVARARSAEGPFVIDPSGSYLWRGTVDVDAALVDAGATVAVLYSPTAQQGFYEAAATRTSDDAGPGRVRFSFTIAGKGKTAPEPGWSGSAHRAARARLIPFVREANGGRLFDHNRVPGDFDTYELVAANDYAVADEAGVCPAVAPKATLTFDGAWVTTQTGAIVPGADLTIQYALERLPSCRFSRAGYQLWDIEANVKFEPSGELKVGSVTMVTTPNGGGPTRAASPLTVRVPRGTQRIQIWFRNYSAVDRCEAYDSNYGRNYWFDVVAPPAPVGWAGDWGNGNWRACEHRAGVEEPIVIDRYVRERACLFVDAEVWVPGLTDAAERHPERLWAQAEWSLDGNPTTFLPLQFVDRVGNNYRYRLLLPYEVRQPSFTGAAFAFRFSTDGNRWYRIAQAAGPDGGAPRTIVTR
jgi:hypothetical protein